MTLPETYRVLLAQGLGEEPKLANVPLPKVGKNQVLVKIAFAPINPADISSIKGLYPNPVKPPHPVGLEASGTVAAVGEDLNKPHKIGDQVFTGGLGTFAEYLLTSSEACTKIQGELSMEEAACHFANPGTAVVLGRLMVEEGHKAAIHTSGSSALGRMLIRYFKYKGIKLINVVRKDEYIEELKKEGADYVLNSQAPDFESQLKEIAEREGATVSFEAVAGELTGKILRNQPNNSTCYIYGGLSGTSVNNIDVADFIFKGKTIKGFWLMPYVLNLIKNGGIEQLYADVYGLLPTIFKSSIQKVFKLQDYQEAIAFYSENSSKGKILLQP